MTASPAILPERGDVARPPQALVALRAVGGHIQEIAILPPLNIMLQLIEQWM